MTVKKKRTRKKKQSRGGIKYLLIAALALLSYLFYILGFDSPVDFESLLSPKSESSTKSDDISRSDSDNKTLFGEVVKVADGDTFTIRMKNGEQIKVRLYGIDAPENGQDFGTKSRQYLNDLCYGKDVSIRKIGVDQYGRTLGIVYVGDVNVNEKLVRNGLAWYYKQYAKQYYRLDSLEQLARKEKLNIWSMKNPVPPHEFRKKK